MSARTRRASATSRGPKHVPLSSPATVLTGPTAAPAATLAGNVVSAKSALPDIRDCTMARLEEMKKQVDDDYASFVRELAASTARLSKRAKELEHSICSPPKKLPTMWILSTGSSRPILQKILKRSRLQVRRLQLPCSRTVRFLIASTSGTTVKNIEVWLSSDVFVSGFLACTQQ